MRGETNIWSAGLCANKWTVHSFVKLCPAVCAEAFNPDEDEEDKEPWVGCAPCHNYLLFYYIFYYTWHNQELELGIWIQLSTINMTYSVQVPLSATSQVCVLFRRSPTQRPMSRDRDYRKRVGTFFCSRIWIRWVDYSISTLLASGLSSAIS